MKKPIGERQKVLTAFLNDEISKQKAAELLGVTPRSIQNYKKVFLEKGVDGLKDHRHSNHFKLTERQKQDIITLKGKDRWRSARNVRDYLKLSVSEVAVWKIFKEHNLVKENLERVKPLTRFEADNPNDLWQTDIMGKINFPNIGTLAGTP